MSTPFHLLLPRHLYEAMIEQAVAELPNECCGLLAGVPGKPVVQAVRCYPLVNAAASPTEYLSQPESMFAAVRDMRKPGLEILAVYHSHPTSEPVPSRTDRERNYSPEVMNFIISLQEGEPKVRAWWLTDADSREADWQVVG